LTVFYNCIYSRITAVKNELDLRNFKSDTKLLHDTISQHLVIISYMQSLFIQQNILQFTINLASSKANDSRQLSGSLLQKNDITFGQKIY